MNIHIDRATPQNAQDMIALIDCGGALEGFRIPRKIHYFWFGKGKMPRRSRRFIEGWGKKCPGFEICRWDEFNFDFSGNKFAREAYEAGVYSFVSDYARLVVLYEHGGIQLDTDVEVLKDLTDLCRLEGFIGFQSDGKVNDGQGFGVVPKHPVVKEMLEAYKDISFKSINDGDNYHNMLSPYIRTDCMVRNGLILNGQRQNVKGIEVFPVEYFCPKDYVTRKITVTKNTYSVHHFNASWFTKSQKLKRLIDTVAIRLLGQERGKRVVPFLSKLKNTIWRIK